MPARQRQQTYYGYAFEAWSTCDAPPPPAPPRGAPPRWGGDVNTNEQWCCVVKTRLGPDRLVLGGEVDCVRGTHISMLQTRLSLRESVFLRAVHGYYGYIRRAQDIHRNP